MKILVYVRQWNKDFYVRLAKSLDKNAEIVTISDFKGVGDVWSGKYIYDEKYQKSNSAYDAQKDDIITRCRFLRSLKYNKAEELSNRFWNGINELFDEHSNFDVVLCALIDCYTMDILERIASERKINFISYVTNFIKGYSRISSRGELSLCRRNVSDEEAKNVLDLLLDKKYKPGFSLNKEKSDLICFYLYCRRQAINKIYFNILKFVKGDKYNYHYNTCSINGLYSKYSPKKAKKYYKHIYEIQISDSCVYVPLHYSPESTVDYWCDDKKYALYEESVIDLIKQSDNSIRFLVKEHPAMYGNRNISFYEKLASFSNVEIINPYDNSNELLDKVQNVLVYTGSVGVEALLRNKLVFTVSDNYYFGLHPNMYKISKMTAEDIQKKPENYDNMLFIKELLSGLFIGYSTSGRDIENSDFDKISNEIIRVLKEKD